MDREHNMYLEEELKQARAERDMWKANHDNQVKLRSIFMSRPDLKDRSIRVIALMDELAAAKVRISELEAAEKEHLKEFYSEFASVETILPEKL